MLTRALTRSLRLAPSPADCAGEGVDDATSFRAFPRVRGEGARRGATRGALSPADPFARSSQRPGDPSPKPRGRGCFASAGSGCGACPRADLSRRDRSATSPSSFGGGASPGERRGRVAPSTPTAFSALRRSCSLPSPMPFMGEGPGMGAPAARVDLSRRNRSSTSPSSFGGGGRAPRARWGRAALATVTARSASRRRRSSLRGRDPSARGDIHGNPPKPGMIALERCVHTRASPSASGWGDAGRGGTGRQREH
jgi:hypothetical protein